MNSEVLQYAREHFYQILLINAVLSLMFGSIAFIIGMRRGKRRLGMIGLAVSTIVGVASWVLGLISAAIFTSIILIKTGKKENASTPNNS
jgi:hypothetical protein